MDVKGVVIIVIFIVLFAIVIWGIFYKPSPKSIHIPVGIGDFNKVCNREKVSCNSDMDCEGKCTESAEGEEMVCAAIPDVPHLTKTQQKILGAENSSDNIKPNKYCVPAKAKMDCDISKGGIPVFTGWSGADHMEFDCLCAYPLWASSRTCDTDGTCTGYCQLNPGICENGVFDWDLTKDPKEPVAGMCTCAEGDILVIDNTGLPRCVPNEIVSFYNDLDISTGTSGEQPLIHVDSIPILKTNSNIGCDTSKYTICEGDACCLSPDAVCCSPGFCCPSEFPVCDVTNNRCLKKTTSCSENETKCDKGCCPLSDAVCCGDGVSCCPKAFPVCNIAEGTCNPALLKLTDDNCSEDKNCNGLCCPSSEGTCCGDGEHCCPPEYPICDVKNGMCKKRKE